MEISHIAFLINPFCSKRTKSYALWVEEQVALRTLGALHLDLFFQEWPSSLEGFDQIWVLGGDGTYNFFANAYPNCQIPIAFFKGGTGNDFYWKLYGDISQEAHLNIIISNRIQAVDAGMCNGQLFLNGVGMGLEGEVLESMNAIRAIGGLIGYFLAAIPQIFTFRSFLIRLSLGSEWIERRVFLCMVFNSSRAGGGFHFIPNASIWDNQLDLLLCEPLSIFKRIWYLPKIQQGKHEHISFLHFQQAKQVTILSEKKLKAQIDGELIVSNRFEFHVLPGHFQVIVP
ncbi:diacylglycerol/lipid kinase family protein [Aquirufa ecclesiirivi]|uniref:diacylglycerol/lipid kinase family protein n=1 Tax=Aquirufa ecclesiirivi TaxID=2715124 RepID=UPI0022A81DFF|nr:diacylglycerol kinase family protein [Aquirufa ecclesiirivi]